MVKQTYKVLIFLKRRPGMTLEAFRDYYETHHVALTSKHLVGASRYVRRYVDPAPNNETGVTGELDFDVITELWFEDPATVKALIRIGSDMKFPTEILADEEKVFDRSKTRYATVLECDSDLH